MTEYNLGTNDCELNNMQQDLKYKLDRLLQLLQKEEFKISYDHNVTLFA